MHRLVTKEKKADIEQKDVEQRLKVNRSQMNKETGFFPPPGSGRQTKVS